MRLRSRAVLIIATAGIINARAATGVSGQGLAGITLEVMAGAVRSTALAEDRVANPLLASALGAKFDGAVRAEPAPGFIVSLAARSRLRERSAVDIALGWTSTGLDAVDRAGRRRIQHLNAGHATVGVRYRIVGPAEAGCGFGVLRYFADGGLFASGGELSPLLECGAGAHVGPGQRVALNARAQVHRFRTPALRDAGGQSGSVYRILLQAGFVLGRQR